MLKKIIDIDHWLFTLINQKANFPIFDKVALLIRQPLTWAPLYLFLIIYAFTRFQKKVWWWIFELIVTISFSDVISSHVLKPLIGRIRPCNNIHIANDIRMLAGYCGQNGSFPSSHASNHFAIAMFIFMTMQQVWGKFTLLFFIWAAMISYAQVYVGVHYPLDVTGGMILGCTIGWINGQIFIKKCGAVQLT